MPTPFPKLGTDMFKDRAAVKTDSHAIIQDSRYVYKQQYLSYGIKHKLILPNHRTVIGPPGVWRIGAIQKHAPDGFIDPP